MASSGDNVNKEFNHGGSKRQHSLYMIGSLLDSPCHRSQDVGGGGSESSCDGKDAIKLVVDNVMCKSRRISKDDFDQFYTSSKMILT